MAILGCTGLIGGALVRVLLAANHSEPDDPIRITGVARRDAFGWVGSPPAGLDFVQCSVSDGVARDLVRNADLTVYIAGTTRDYVDRPQETMETQMGALQSCLDAARPGAGFVFVSSARVYGRPTNAEPFTEETPAVVEPMHPDNLYDSAKRWAESLCQWYARNRELRATVVRMTHIYGPFTADPPETLVTDLVRQAVRTGTIRLQDPGSVRNHCSVLDAAQGIVLALVSGRAARAYNIGSREHLTIRRLADTIRAQFPGSIAVAEPASPPAPSVQHISIERAAEELGYEPGYRFDELAPLVVEQTAAALDG